MSDPKIPPWSIDALCAEVRRLCAEGLTGRITVNTKHGTIRYATVDAVLIPRPKVAERSMSDEGDEEGPDAEGHG